MANTSGGKSAVKNTPSKKPSGTKKKTTTAVKNAKTKSSAKNDTFIKEEQGRRKMQTMAVLLFCLALLMLVICVIPGASVWEFIRQKIVFGTFGVSAFLLPIFIGYIAIICNKEMLNDKGTKGQIICFSVLIVILGSLIHIIANESAELLKTTIWEQIASSYTKGLNIGNGGLFGALIGGGLSLICGRKAPAVAVMSIACFCMIMIVTRTTLATLKKALVKPVKKAGDRFEQYREERRTERETVDELFEHPNDFTPEIKKSKKEEPEFVLPPINEDTEIPDFNEGDIVMPKIILGGGKTGTDRRKDSIRPLDIDYIDEIPDEAKIEEEPLYEEPVEIVKPIIGKKTVEKAPAKIVQTEKPKATESTQNAFEVTDTAFVSTKSGKNKPYKFPPLSCLSTPDNDDSTDFTKELKYNGQKLVEILKSFGVETKISEICRGPSVTRYEIQPAPGVKISKITGLSDDIAMNMAASGVRIEAPIPNKSAVGIEIPNRMRTSVLLREIIDTPVYRKSESKLNVALGKDITGNIICADLAKMPHLLIAGTTGSGKSVCINSMITSILYNATPDEVKLLMIDPKQVEFTVYNGIPHLLVPVVSDPRKSAGALAWAVTEMLNRYKLFAERNVRNIKGYNKFCEANPDIPKMPQIVIFIDELSDLMMAAPNEVEDSICRLAQMARAAGMHLVIATQRPSVNVITGIIKANIPSRISLSVSSQIDSRTIIDTAGAEKLLGNGDMLFSPVGTSKPLRVQGSFLSDAEVERVVEFIKSQKEGSYDEDIIEEIEKHAVNEKKKQGFDSSDDEDDDADEMLPNAIAVVVENQAASTTMLQKKLKLGYARASRIIDDLEARGIVGPSEGAKPRKVLLSKQEYMEMNALSSDGAIDMRKTQPTQAEDEYEDISSQSDNYNGDF